MLNDYETVSNTGMDILRVSEEIYLYTSGYPFLVSRICKHVDERLEKDWSIHGIQEAVKIILKEENTLFDDLSKNLENNSELYNFIYNILLIGEDKSFQIDNPLIKHGVMFGILGQRDNKVIISNKIFEMRLYNYFISKDESL